MNTHIEKEFEIDQPVDVVWKSLADPEDIVTCVPGAAITEKVDDMNYKGKVVTKFGPVKVKYNGDIEIVELDEIARKMTLKGRGLDSKGKGSADMVMNGTVEEKDGKTNVKFTMDITIVGMLAQFGSRLINDVSSQLLNQFIDNFKNKLDASNPVLVASESSETENNEISVENSGASEETVATSTVTSPEKKPVVKVDNTLKASSLFGTILKSIWGAIVDFFRSLFGLKKSN